MAEQVSIKIHFNSSADQAATIDKVPAPKPPFDLRKVFAALIVLALVIFALLHLMWPANAEPTAESNAFTNQQASQVENNSDKAELPALEASTEQPQTEQFEEIAAESSSIVATEVQQLQPSTTEQAVNEPLAAVKKNTSETNQAKPETDTAQAKQQTNDLANTTPSTSEQAELASEQISIPAAQANVTVEPIASKVETATNEEAIAAENVDRELTHSSEQTNKASSQVARAQLSSAISQREPVDNLTRVELSQIQQVYLFMELREMQGQSIQINWYRQQQLQASVELDIGGPRWRTNASKRFDLNSRGDWQVAIYNQQQVRIFEQNFTVE
ncbi:DUF2914 domain-containing protein [Agarivorans sp. B2Z047]|uniref:DUF2914 domain-containing protein n=1 Tax=Agarivorans sp. B2Z047 TaxID=2652721 RepID=UPI00128D05F3|nr:DUF2914 domain-containing protein [Agarivorans sp. B2Z047]MPW31331.1 DUF2914 domain-containing protein [Agarivorans sp. B2Z047]UQN42706.1 DUF2914 domain-containing protein [Agarivorans sp. B2Z047]